MSPRCGHKDNTKIVFIQREKLFFLFLPNENYLYYIRYHFAGARHSWHFLPLLPTTPFLLLTAALYFKGSPRLYQWLLNHKYFGTYIRNFRENKAIPLRAKIISLLLMWGTMLYCIFFLIPLVWVKILLFLIAAGVTYHILSFKTLKK